MYEPRALTLNDIDRKSLGGPLHIIDFGRTHIVSIEAGVEIVDENATVAVNGDVHSWRHSGAVVHSEAYVCG